MTELGHSLRPYFRLYEKLLNFNHGSFGAVPNNVMQTQQKFLEEQESCPELWFREWYPVHLNKSRASVAKLIAADVDDVVLVENASYAVNSIINSFPFKVTAHFCKLLYFFFFSLFNMSGSLRHRMVMWCFALIVHTRWSLKH